jgi:hypothetical protein
MMKKVTRPEQDEINAFVGFIKETTDFEAKVHGYELDQEYEANDGQIIYSIDTDIVHLFLKPLEMGANRNDPDTGARQRTGYSQIFRSDPQELAGAIGDALSEAIFFRNTGQIQAPVEARHLLIFPGVDQEIVREINRILETSSMAIKTAQGAASRLDHESILRELKEFEGEALYEEVHKRLPELYEMFFAPSNTASVAKRLRRLMNEGSLTAVTSLSMSYADRFPLKFIQLVQESLTSKEFETRRLAIAEMLARHIRDANKPTDAQVNDILTLSAIIALNERTAKFGFKTCHLTGSWRLHEGLKSFSVLLQSGKEGEFFEKEKGHLSENSISADKYFLRWPVAFWQSHSFRKNVHPDASEESDLDFIWNWTKWVDAIVPSGAARLDLTNNQLIDFANRALSVGMGIRELTELQQRWKRFSSLIIPSRAKALEEFSEEFSALFSGLDQAFRRTFDTLMDSCARVGVAFGKIGGARSRMTPPILFECNSEAQFAIDAVEAALKRSAAEAQGLSFNDAFSSLMGDDQPSDKYFFNVGVAIIFANQGELESAKMFATRAATIAQNLSPAMVESTEITGREAYFLICVLTRLTARSPLDLEISSTYMRLARNRLEIDVRRNPKIGISAVRFDCEVVAHEVGVELFKGFRRNDIDLSLSFSKDILRRVQVLHDARYEAYEAHLKPRLDVRLSINAISASLYCRRLVEYPELEMTHLSGLAAEYAIVERNLPNLFGGGEEGSYLHKVTIAAYLLIWGVKANLPAPDPELIRELMSFKEIKRHIVTAYDHRRFIWLKGQIESRLPGLEGN